MKLFNRREIQQILDNIIGMSEQKIRKIYNRIKKQPFDMRVLSNEYSMINRLKSYFSLSTHPSEGKFIEAFLSLLLYIKKWDLQKAMGLLDYLINSPFPNDPNRGNIIKISNPINDFDIYNFILDANDLNGDLFCYPLAMEISSEE